VRRRLRSIIRGKGLLAANVEQNLLIVTNEHWRLDNDDDVNKLVNEVIIPYRPAVVMLDPYRNLHHTDENSADAQMTMMERLLYLRDTFGVTFLVCHHFGKENLQGRTPREGDELRGSSVLWASAAGGLLIYPTSSDRTVRLALHHKEGSGRQEVLVKLDFAPDVDDDGGAVTFTVFPSGEGKGTSPDRVLTTIIDLHHLLKGGWPTLDQIASAVGLQPRTVAAKINVLVQSHLVEYQGGPKEKRRYAPTEDALIPDHPAQFPMPEPADVSWPTERAND
jgi:hypothetical protein